MGAEILKYLAIPLMTIISSGKGLFGAFQGVCNRCNTIIFATAADSRLTGFPTPGSVFQWIEFQIPILKMQVRFLPGLPVNQDRALPVFFVECPGIRFLSNDVTSLSLSGFYAGNTMVIHRRNTVNNSR